MKKQLFAILLILVCCSCSSTKVVQPVRDVSKDSIYLTSQQYDSVYIYHDRSMEYYPSSQSRILNPESLIAIDTLYIKDKSTEYRYKLLRDTVRVVERDSIPYEVTITEVKEITRPLTWYDKLCRSCFWFLVGILFYTTIRHLYKLRYAK